MALTYSQMLPLNTELPKFKLLNVLTDKDYSTESLQSEKNTVVMIICNHCPYVIHYHDELKKAGACFGVAGGFERPMWYSLNGEEPKYNYSFNYQNWYPSAKHETINARKNVGLFDFSTFSKFDLKGEKTHQELQKICTANIKTDIGKSIYTYMLNEDG